MISAATVPAVQPGSAMTIASVSSPVVEATTSSGRGAAVADDRPEVSEDTGRIRIARITRAAVPM